MARKAGRLEIDGKDARASGRPEAAGQRFGSCRRDHWAHLIALRPGHGRIPDRRPRTARPRHGASARQGRPAKVPDRTHPPGTWRSAAPAVRWRMPSRSGSGRRRCCRATTMAIICIRAAWVGNRLLPTEMSSRMTDVPGRKIATVSREQLFRQVWATTRPDWCGIWNIRQ